MLLVLIDDAGFGNPSTFGGPIQTPNYTRLAEGGLRYNRFHVTALCSPTRAALLTARNNHAVGFGSAGEFSSGFPGYTAIRPLECAPLPRILRDNGYSTAACGKWHLTLDGQQGPAGRSTAGRTAGASTTSTASSAVTRASGTRAWPRTRRSEDHRHAGRVLRPGRLLLPSRRHGRQDHRVAARGPGPGAGEAVLRLLLHRLQPRPAPRRRRLGPSTRASSTGAGTGRGRKCSRGRSSSGSCPPTRS